MNRSLVPIRRVLLALVIAAALLAPISARSQAAVTLTASPAFEGNYTLGTWLPVDVQLRNDGPPLKAVVAAALPEATFRNVQAIDLPGGAEKRLTLYVAMEQAVPELRITVEADGAVLAEQVLAVRPRSSERMLGILAAEDPRLSLPRRQDLAALPFMVVSLSAATLPERAAGLSSLGLLLLGELPAEGLSPAQAATLAGWVSGGGHLIIGGGPAAARTVSALPHLLQPAAIGATTQISDAPLAALADASGPGPLAGVVLTPMPDARAVGPAAAPAWVRRDVGQGAVTQLAFDPGLPALAAWEGAPLFWDQLLRSPTLVSTLFGLQPRADALQEQLIAGALTALPAISLPPANLIFVILAVYAVLVGPGTALLLRRYDRQAWMWVVVPALSLAVGALVFGLAFATRADQRVITQLSLVESLDAGQARARTYLAALSPQNQTLAAELTVPALVRPVRGATGMYGSVSGAGGDIAQDGPAVDLSVERWQLQGLVAEEQLALDGVGATIVTGAGGPQVEVRNNSDQVLRGTVAVYGERVVALGDLRPGERAAAPWPAAPLGEVPRSTAISYLVLRDELDEGRRPGQAPDRRVLAREALINAAVARG
ncbi:MAG: hypothetical protein HGA45_37365, partial [Chloroflexales bacterium]|nr:hypothetical protein [Chloroflexales bacterium]